MYDTALSHTSNPENRMTVLRAQADHYYSIKKFELAASLYASPPSRFLLWAIPPKCYKNCL